MWGRGRVFAGLVLVVLARDAQAADIALPLAVKAPPQQPAYDWSGFYAGANFGYAGGASHWSAVPIGAAAPPLNGSIDFYNSYDMFKGTGSYFMGFQGGYNIVTPSRLLLGI